MTQCVLTKNNSQTVAFIPTHAAVPGKRVELLSADGEFWTVQSAGVTLDYDKVNQMSRGYKQFQGSTKGGGIDS